MQQLKNARIRAALFGAVVLINVALTGCFTAPRFSPSGVPQDPSESRLQCEQAQRGSTRIDSFRALLNASVVEPRGDTHSFRYAVVARGEREFRVDILPPEGAYTLGLLVVRDGRALCLDPGNKRFVQGCQPEDVFEKFFGLKGITPEVVRALITERLPALPCDSVQTYQSNSHLLQMVESRTPRAWTIDGDSGRVQGVTVLDTDETTVLARAEVETGAQRSILIEIFKPVHAHATLTIAKYSSNPSITDALFSVSIPADYEQDRC